MSFAKIFESEKFGQLCAISRDADEGKGPEIKVYCHPEAFGVCEVSTIFEETDAGYDKRDKLFGEMCLEKAELLAQSAFEAASRMAI